MPDVKVDYRIYLYSLDFRDPDVKKLLVDGPDIKYADPIDYFNVNSKIHWKVLQQQNNIDFKDNWVKILREFKEKLINLISQGKITLTTGIDITKNIKLIAGFRNSLDDFANSISFKISESSEFDRAYDNGLIETKKIKDFISENQIIEVKINRNNSLNLADFKTAYIGFIGSISYSKSYGMVPEIDIGVFGLNKFFGQSNTIETQALYNQFEEGIEITYSGVPVYQTNWNNLNTGQIFSQIMQDILALKATNLDTSLEEIKSQLNKVNTELSQLTDDLNKNTNKQQILLLQRVVPPEKAKQYEYDLTTVEGKIKEDEPKIKTLNKQIEALNKQYNTRLDEIRTKVDKIYFQFDTTRLTSVQDFRSAFLLLYSFYLVRTNSTLSDDVKKNIAILEHGEHKTFNEMVAKGFATFYSQMAKPIDILRVVKDASFYDIFENRYGQIICRPQKYNQLYIDFPTVGQSPTPSDFTILRVENLSESYHRNDIDISSRCDTKYMFPFIGEVPFIGGWYTDGNILIKYGLRAIPPANNPNVTNSWLAAIFSAMNLYKQNAYTRQIAISVANTRDFEIGRLYYIELNDDTNKDMYVGYLMSIETTFDYGKVSRNILNFIYIRKVYRRWLDSFAASATTQDLDLIYTIYRDKIFDSLTQDDKLKLLANEKNINSRTLYALQYLNKFLGQKKEVIYFSIIPSIIDVINQVEFDESKGKSVIDKQTKELSGDDLKGILASKNHVTVAKADDEVYYYAIPSGTVETTTFPKTKEKLIPLLTIKAMDLTTTEDSTSYKMIIPFGKVLLDQTKFTGLGTDGILDYFKSGFPIGLFDSPTAGSNSFVNQLLINALVSIDASYKYYNLQFKNTFVGPDNFTGGYDFFTLNKTTKKFVSPWFTIYSKETGGTGIQGEVIEHWFPTGSIYRYKGSIIPGVSSYEELFELQGGKYYVQYYQDNVIFYDEFKKAVRSPSGTFVTINKNDSLFFFNKNENDDLNLKINLEKLFVKNGGVVWGYRLPQENKEIIGSAEVTDSTDRHYRGSAVDFAFINYRTMNNGRLMLNTAFIDSIQLLLNTAMNNGIIKNGNKFMYPYQTNFVGDLTWAQQDVWVHIDVPDSRSS